MDLKHPKHLVFLPRIECLQSVKVFMVWIGLFKSNIIDDSERFPINRDKFFSSKLSISKKRKNQCLTFLDIEDALCELFKHVV